MRGSRNRALSVALPDPRTIAHRPWETTPSDRLLQVMEMVADRDAQDQHLDAMNLEREHGVTIKMHPVALTYKARDGPAYKLNLLDPPGHLASTDVSRSLAACEGALVIVDAAQRVEAQTVGTVHLANKTTIPVINKIDLPNSNLPRGEEAAQG